MRLRSTGLGKTELIGDLAELARHGRTLVLHVHTNRPVKWHVRAALSEKDVLALARAMLRPAVGMFVLRALARGALGLETAGEDALADE